MRIKVGLIGIALLALVATSLGCPEEGPMEKAGREIDEAVEDMRHPGEGPLEEAGRKVDEAIEDLGESGDE